MTDLIYGLEHRVLAYTLGPLRPTGPRTLEPLLDQLGLRVHYTGLPPGISGRTWYYDERPQIEISDEIHSRRATFTIAHELGHVLVDRWRASSKAPELIPRQEALEERLCDRIAGELLMPTAWARTQAANLEAPYLQGILEVAEEAQVTVASACTRMRQLGLPVHTWQLRRSQKLDPHWAVINGARRSEMVRPNEDLLRWLDQMPRHTVVSIDPGTCFGRSAASLGSAAVVIWGRNAFLLAEHAGRRSDRLPSKRCST